MKISEDSQELSAEVRKEIAEARVEIKAGRFHTFEEVKRELGLSDLQLEWVKPGRDGRKGYFRKIPYTRERPSVAQAHARLRFSQVATSTFGVRGVVNTVDGRAIPMNAGLIAEKTVGSNYLTEQEQEFAKLGKWEKLLLLLSIS